MNVYSKLTRGIAVCLLGAVVLKQTNLIQDARDLFISEDSTSLLYSKHSPFQNKSFLTEVVGVASLPLPPKESTDDEQFTLTIKRGDTLSSLWRDIKGAPEALHSFVKAFSKRHPKIRAGGKLEITRRGDEVVEVRRELGEGATLVISGDFDSGYAPRIEQAAISTRERSVSGTIFSSLANSARNLDLPYSVVDDLVDLFGNRVEFSKDLRAGDTFTVLYDERSLENGEVVSTGPIKAASLLIQGDLYAVVRDEALDGTVRYFD